MVKDGIYLVKDTFSDKVFDVINIFILSMVLVIVLYPLIYIASASISDPGAVASGEMLLLPKGITFEGYQRVFAEKDILIGYGNTIYYTIVGTLVNVIFTLLCAYPLSRRDLQGRNIYTAVFTFTMFFGGGLIPLYLLVKGMGMLNTTWAMIIPGAIAMWNVIITRTYFQSLPTELQEAAQIDGCSNFRLFVTIILPLSAPIIAVISLFYGVGHWNSFFNGLIFLSDRSKYPLQLFLREILIQQQMSTNMISSGGDLASLAEQAKIADIIKYAVIIVASLPVLIIYPFLQKFFVKGIMIGAIKG